MLKTGQGIETYWDYAELWITEGCDLLYSVRQKKYPLKLYTIF